MTYSQSSLTMEGETSPVYAPFSLIVHILSADVNVGVSEPVCYRRQRKEWGTDDLFDILNSLEPASEALGEVSRLRGENVHLPVGRDYERTQVRTLLT